MKFTAWIDTSSWGKLKLERGLNRIIVVRTSESRPVGLTLFTRDKVFLSRNDEGVESNQPGKPKGKLD